MMANKTEILAAIRREKENHEWINKFMADLRQKYGDRYIAVEDHKVIDEDRDFSKLLARVRKMEDPGAVTIEFISALEYLWML